MKASENTNQLLRITAVHDEFVEASTLLDDQAKDSFKRISHDVRNHWEELKRRPSITDHYSIAEIGQIDGIIANDEQNRYAVLKKCLNKKAIPSL